MANLLSLPLDVFKYILFPYLTNQSIFNLYRTCKYYTTNIDTHIMDDLRSVYFLAITVDDVSSQYRSFFIARNLNSFQSVIKNYAKHNIHRGLKGIRNYQIRKVKFGQCVNASKMMSKPVKKFSSLTEKKYPPLYGIHKQMTCNAYVSKLFNYMYQIKPVNNTQLYTIDNSVEISCQHLIDTVIISFE